MSNQIGKEILAFSAVTGRGLSDLMVAIQKQLEALEIAQAESAGS
jgi:hypothetical protein